MTDEIKDSMSRSQAVHLLLDMMRKADNQFEVEALQLACRCIVKRCAGSAKAKANRKFKGDTK